MKIATLEALKAEKYATEQELKKNVATLEALKTEKYAMEQELKKMDSISFFSDQTESGFSPEEKILQTVKVFNRIRDEIAVDWNYYKDIFGQVEFLGWHLLPVHYYSPTASQAEVVANAGGSLFIGEPLLDFREDKQRSFLQVLSARACELEDIPIRTDQQGDYCWDNGMFGLQDGLLYYSIIREFAPLQIVEIGSGMSTLIAARAASLNDTTSVTAIEPYPVEFFNKHLRTSHSNRVRLIEQKIQDVDLDFFEGLEEGDILFIDSSHVAKVGSDVLFIFFKILPRLQPGVFVHFHDIFLPYEYPASYYRDHKWFWNEHYLLAMFLMFNRDFEIFFANNYCNRHFKEEYVLALQGLLTPDATLTVDPSYKAIFGSSFWIRKVLC